VLWRTKWRVDQKEPERRTDAAERGIRGYFNKSGCFAKATIRRIEASAAIDHSTLDAIGTAAAPRQTVMLLTVRELGPVISLLNSLALIDGGAEVVLDVSPLHPATLAEASAYSVHWQNGGPGFVKGVASLPEDMQAALAVALAGRGARP
jgi:hypothetical protein